MTSNGVIFEFVVQDHSGAWFRLDVRPYDAAAKPWFASVWQRTSAALVAAHQQTDSPAPAWLQWKPWDWCERKRPGYEDRDTLVGWCGSQVVGFLNVWSGFESQCEPGQSTLYLEHLAAVPWNLNTELWRRRYGQIGAALLAYAVKASQDRGMGGRVSLHASGDAALAFYRKIAENRDPTLFFPEKAGITGPTPHAARTDAALTYLEMTPEGAITFLEDYRRE